MRDRLDPGDAEVVGHPATDDGAVRVSVVWAMTRASCVSRVFARCAVGASGRSLALCGSIRIARPTA